MHTIRSIALAGLLALAFAGGCGKDETGAEANKAEAPALAPAPAAAASEDACVKAKACIEALAQAEPDRARAHAGVLESIEAAEGAAKQRMCRQALTGASYNPNAPAACE